MKKISFQVLLLTLIFLTACEEQPIDITQTAPDSNRKILIEEFTGANCAACPKGAAQIENLQAVYGEAIVAMSIHTTVSGPLGKPLDGASYDLRTQTGDDLANLFGGLSAIPAAVFNRTKFAGESKMAVLAPDTWVSNVIEELETDPVVEVTTELEYEETTRTLTINVEALPLADRTGDFRLGVAITESHIIDKQNDNGTVVDEYENNHILREYISAINGDAIGSNFLLNTPITKTYTFQIPEEDGIWVAQNCSIVTFVSEVNAQDGTIKVLQADEEHLGE